MSNILSNRIYCSGRIYKWKKNCSRRLPNGTARVQIEYKTAETHKRGEKNQIKCNDVIYIVYV